MGIEGTSESLDHSGKNICYIKNSEDQEMWGRFVPSEFREIGKPRKVRVTSVCVCGKWEPIDSVSRFLFNGTFNGQ